MTIYKSIEEILKGKSEGDTATISGRVSSVKRFKEFAFINLEDSSGRRQIVLPKENFSKEYDDYSRLGIGSYIRITGILSQMDKDPELEIKATGLEVLARSRIPISPNPWHINGTDKVHQDQVIGNASLYQANPQRMAILRVYSRLRQEFHKFFQADGYLEVIPPVINHVFLYGEESSVPITVNGEDVWLTQCSTFELEPLALAHGNVYTISPAFRNESAGTNRHLNEYYHLKAEALLATMDDLIKLSSDAIFQAVSATVLACQDELKFLKRENFDLTNLDPKNHIRITYLEALDIVKKYGSQTPFGKDLNMEDERRLIEHMGGNKYVWITHKPREAEGFPYRSDPINPLLTMTGDLIAPHKSGEMVGIAEKIYDYEELIVSITQKGLNPLDYAEYLNLRLTGLPPHGGIGAAPERIAYGIMDLPHIKYIMPYPRYPGRKVNPRTGLNPTNSEYVTRILEKHNLMHLLD